MKQWITLTVLGASLASAQLLEEKRIEGEKRIERRVAEPNQAGDFMIWDQVGPGMPGINAFEFQPLRISGPAGIVKGSPYSADVTSESTQTLADGNRIIHRSTASFARDREGRTRCEFNVEPPNRPQEAHKIVMIEDPVAGVHYLLNTREKTAHKMPIPKPGETKWFTAATPAKVLSAPARTGVVTAGPMTMGHRVEIDRRPGDRAAVESLGKQNMEGVEVTGSRTTMRIPAGQIGNEREIVSTTESWFSEELKTAIFTKRSDPRFGDSTTRATNVRRGDPARHLFEVPGDFKVEESAAGQPIRIERKL